jgi:hypothetical protein
VRHFLVKHIRHLVNTNVVYDHDLGIMQKFLVGYKPPPAKRIKTADERLDQQRKYEKEGRERLFLPKWRSEFCWLKHDPERGMICSVCCETDPNGPFVTGTKNYKKETLIVHEKSYGHQHNTKKHNAKANPSATEGFKALQSLNQLTISRLCLKFRNAHAICVKGRPYTDYVLYCQLDEAKGQDIGTQYRSDKSAADFVANIAETERVRIRQQLSKAKFVSAISDGSTDSSHQEAEIVYVRHCTSGKIHVNFSLVKNSPKADSQHIADIISQGITNLTDMSKLVAIGTDGANVMLGNKSGAVQRIRVQLDRPWLFGMHCAGHKLELAYKDMVKSQIPLYKKLDGLLLNLYYYYRNSNLNRACLKETFRAFDEKIVLPTRIGGTRWVSHLKRAIVNYLAGYHAISEHLHQVIKYTLI